MSAPRGCTILGVLTSRWMEGTWIRTVVVEAERVKGWETRSGDCRFALASCGNSCLETFRLLNLTSLIDSTLFMQTLWMALTLIQGDLND